MGKKKETAIGFRASGIRMLCKDISTRGSGRPSK